MVRRNQSTRKTNQDYKFGSLPSIAPLAISFIPFQDNNPPRYESNQALTRGTLFPGLDLPFMNIANKNNPLAGTHLGDLMALDFVVTELNLYLDTHCDDMEAFEFFKSVVQLQKVAYEKYVQMHGPVNVKDTAMFDEYNWIHDPWPWEYCEEA